MDSATKTTKTTKQSLAKLANAFRRAGFSVSHEGDYVSLCGHHQQDDRRRINVGSIENGMAHLRAATFAPTMFGINEVPKQIEAMVSLCAPMDAIAEVLSYVGEQMNGSYADSAFYVAREEDLRDAAEQSAFEYLDGIIPEPELFKPFRIAIDVTAIDQAGEYEDRDLTIRVDGRWLVASPEFSEQIERVRIVTYRVSLG